MILPPFSLNTRLGNDTADGQQKAAGRASRTIKQHDRYAMFIAVQIERQVKTCQDASTHHTNATIHPQ
jgi:hypothetical protein